MMSRRERRYVRPSGSELPAPKVKRPEQQRVRLVICAIVAKDAAPMPDPAEWRWSTSLGDDLVSLDLTKAHEYCQCCGRCGPCDDDVQERMKAAADTGTKGAVEMASHWDVRGPAWEVHLTLRCQPGGRGATAWDWNQLLGERIHKVSVIPEGGG